MARNETPILHRLEIATHYENPVPFLVAVDLLL